MRNDASRLAGIEKGVTRRYSPPVIVAAEKNRRFIRFINAFSKKLSNHYNAPALYFFFYNFCKLHKSLKTTAAQAAAVTDEPLSMEHLCAIIDAANPPKKRGPYKKAG